MSRTGYHDKFIRKNLQVPHLLSPHSVSVNGYEYVFNRVKRGMIEETSQTEGIAERIKKVQKGHHDQRRRLHNQQQMQMQTFLAKHRSAYEKAATEQERAMLLTTYVQTLSQRKQTYALRQKRLLARQAKQRENLMLKVAGSFKINRRKRMKTARSIIETSTRASLVPSVTWYG